ncbi:hypothetical protein E3O11_01550 [Cryobacterium levicorallinum]|uniref:Right handed beta helix region n=1 Tax=Cryobacterium levicorallinum TaxID=995038 RepID=A0A1I3BD63_9MICO|nr:right-handed parallel beta-helix repeat-containing protein [Cryobacterium levicorallinum]TFB88909.1 hypothetical protein E3O11_01550 [Cryobacterium levicorallinum]GEP28078.1 hypothetical protein CLE01_26760 [Cryobacterium levicorallinum]SFH60224.1 Right handed beta helix region [Cryobacterium levicorallinum]
MKQLLANRPWFALGAAFLGGALAVGLVWASVSIARPAPAATVAEPTAGASPVPSPSATAAQQDSVRPQPGAGCPRATIDVVSADELSSALIDAAPGDVIGLADGNYQGNFVATTSGTVDEPITLCGGTDSVLDGGDPMNGYVMHLDGAQYWNLVGFSVTNGQKGVMADGTVGSTIRALTVSTIGDEAIHLRRFSTDNTVADNIVFDTGLRKPKFGEGVYIGTADSNWCDISGCQPDRSDRNTVTGNSFSQTTSEAVDVKEGTSNGIVSHNTFDGSALSEADSWVDIKGNGWVIDSNTGTNSLRDGFQTHEILDGWGTDNIFRNNTAAVNGPGFGYSMTPELSNIVECNNTATGAAEGVMNVTCRAS